MNMNAATKNVDNRTHRGVAWIADEEDVVYQFQYWQLWGRHSDEFDEGGKWWDIIDESEEEIANGQCIIVKTKEQQKAFWDSL